MYSEREHTRKQIQLLCGQGISYNKVAKILKVSYNTVVKWSNTTEFKHNYKTQKTKKLTPNTKRSITGHMKDRIGASLRKCTKSLNFSEDYEKRNKTISVTSVQKYMKSTDWGKNALKLKIKPLLTKKNINDCLVFALNVQKDGYCDDSRHGIRLRDNVLWTDESPIELNPIPNSQNTRVRTSEEGLVEYGVPKKSISIMVAGGMTSQGVTQLYVSPIGEKIGGKVYEDNILPIYLNALQDDKLFTCKRLATMQQDSAPGHITKTVIAKIEAKFPNSWTHGIWPGRHMVYGRQIRQISM